MDHSHMDHGDMDHGGGGHGGMPMCSMNMLFTWDTTNLCIVFRQWHITGRVSLIFSLLAIVAICAGYEALREATRKYELWLSNQDVTHNGEDEEDEEDDDNPVSGPKLFPIIRRVTDTHAHPAGFAGGCRSHDEERDPRFQHDNPQEQEQVAETTPFLGIERIGGSPSEAPIGQPARIIKAVLYGVQNFYAFMIMLLFMTYNGYVMIAVGVGAGLGYYIFGAHTRVTKETACH